MDTVLWWIGLAANLSIIPATLGWLSSRRVERAAIAERARLQQVIRLVLLCVETGQPRRIPGTILRGNFRREGVLGHIGMIRRVAPGHYQLAYLESEEFFDMLNAVALGNNEGVQIVSIPCSKAEFDQFRPEGQ